ncbi:mitochondrial ribonuclease P protein 1 homolog [Bradysia coprophila]|uniref:mitochondrial ribonuclease P protein 1 homolog n=1 Tax=Bradysia coprophila TaxID=38358 RepID=UPI00187D87DF|nr:mitochondrial ribonuclease P protein 1 homolog [Bradysia coprophila]
MILVKRCCFFTQNLCSLYQSSSLHNISSKCMLPNKFHFLRLSSSSVKQENEVGTFGDEDRHIKLIKIEIALIREKGGDAPDINLIKKRQWDELLKLETKTARRKYYKYLFSKEQTDLNRQLRKEERKQRLVLEPPHEEPHISYSLGRTTFLLRISKSTINTWRHNRLFRAVQFGEKLIFDCSYDEYMIRPEAITAAAQLTRTFSDNRKDGEPFDLHFCNVDFNSVTMKHLERQIPTMRNKEFPMNLHECSYLDLFPKEQLVYLTPHCNNDLTEFDPNKIYIVGAMVNKTNHEPLSFGKAKELNLKMARIPLDRYLHGTSYFKYLTLDQMVRILLDLKRTGKWEVALQHVPRTVP